MKAITQYLRTGVLSVALGLVGGLLSACNDDIELKKFDSQNFEKINEVYCSLRNSGGSRVQTFELRAQAVSTNFYVSLSKASDRAVDITLKVDEMALKAYNEQHKTSYELFPTNLVSIEADGILVIAPGDLKSDPLALTFGVDKTLTTGATYALPVALEVKTADVKLAQQEPSMFFVKVMNQIPSTDKGTGIITICYVECNSNNPLNAGEWRLRKSGKPLVDIVNLFAANINYIEKTGRIGVSLNPNIKHLLDNRDKYIKPLQEMGMKVCLTILGNHDGTGVANLSDVAAREFAAELKSLVDAYGLDGIDFDDEHSDYGQYPQRPGCVKRNGAAYARLCYETKRAMPDKLCTVYYIGASVPDPDHDSHGFNAMIGGMMPCDFVDYSYNAFYGTISESYKTILGMDKKQWGPTSIDMGDYAYRANIRFARKNGYGVQVIYDLRAADTDYATQNRYIENFDILASELYDDTGIVFSGKNHHATW